MAKLETISEKVVANIQPPSAGYDLHYASGLSLQGKKAPPGFAVRVTANGVKSFVWFHRVDGKPFLETIGRWDQNEKGGTHSVYDAIVAAQKRAKAVRDGAEDPRPARTRRAQTAPSADLTVAGLLDRFVEEYAKPQLRSADTYASVFEDRVKPHIGAIALKSLRRVHVGEMLNKIAAKHGPVMADRTLAYLRKAFNWYNANYDEDFHNPITKGMARTKPKERAGRRILSDDEIREVWAALDGVTEPACFGRYVRFLLLTATRRNEAADMVAAELDGDLWTIPADRYKTKLAHTIPLTEAARDLIGDKPDGFQGNSWHVFSTTGGAKPFAGFSKAKAALDAAINEARAKAGLEPMPGWRLHDLRRTARSLMSRAGVPTDHAERALGHVIGGVRETYDRHEYAAEKRAAFEALAALVDRIINPPAANVTPIRAERVGA